MNLETPDIALRETLILKANEPISTKFDFQFLLYI